MYALRNAACVMRSRPCASVAPVLLRRCGVAPRQLQQRCLATRCRGDVARRAGRTLTPSAFRGSRHQLVPVARADARQFATGRGQRNAKAAQERNMSLAMYLMAGAVGFVGLAYASVPLYKMFCQATGYGGTTQTSTLSKLKEMKPVPGAHPITINFTANTADTMPWDFKPQQRTIKVVPGEPALACYTAYNPTKRPITGVATYNVTPQKCGVYFTKYQCFCFDEQRLRPGEEIDMPLLFWVDPDILEDPLMGDVRNITLSYTFFKTDEEPEESEAERAARAAAASEAGADATVGAQQRVEEWKQQTVSALGGTGAAADLVEASAATGRPAGPGGEA